MDDEALSGFAAITGASPQVAQHYLSMTDGNIEQAIQLFFDSPELASMASDVAPAPPAPSTRPPRGANTRQSTADDPITIDSDDDMMDEDFDAEDAPDSRIPTQTATPNAAANTTSFDDDEAMARRMQEELYAGGDSQRGFDSDSVRAPIARTTETLVGPGANWGSGDVHDAVLEQLRRRAAPRSDRPGVFNQRAGSSSIWDESNPAAQRVGLAEATGGASEANAKAAKLAELFRPPFELMNRLPWDDARELGKEEKKWILVNIQDPSIFDCQALNRDIWKHEGVRETVKENFVFMQFSKDDPKGNQYMQYYFPLRDSEDAYPHIAIVDPRTGEQVKMWSGRPVPKAMDFLMQLHEFLDRYSLDASIRNPVAKRKPDKAVSMDVDRLTEEQQMEIALQNSMANSKVEGPKAHDPDALTKSIGDVSELKGKGKEAESGDSGVAEPESSASSLFGQISADSPHVEPAGGSGNTRIQFRHSSGRVIHRFALTDPVRRIYEWLKADPIESKGGVEFELKYMGKDLLDSLDESVADAGLANATIMVEFLED